VLTDPARDAAIAANNLWKLSRLATVLERANAAGVPIIVLKGAAVLGHLFELHERPMNDVDLLIRPGDRDRLLDCLAPEVRLAGESPVLDLLPHDLSGEFGASFEGLPLDIHTSLMNRPWLRRIVAVDERELWVRAIPIQVAGQPTLQLSPEDQLLHLASHAVLHHASWERRATEDVRRLIQRGSIDWTRLCDLATQQRLRTPTWLLLDQPKVAPLVPEAVKQQLRPDAAGLRRIGLATRLAGTGDTAFAPMFLTDRAGDPVRAAMVALTPPRGWLRSRYPRLPGTPLRAAWHAMRVLNYLLAKVVRLVATSRSHAPGQQGQSGDADHEH